MVKGCVLLRVWVRVKGVFLGFKGVCVRVKACFLRI